MNEPHIYPHLSILNPHIYRIIHIQIFHMYPALRPIYEIVIYIGDLLMESRDFIRSVLLPIIGLARRTRPTAINIIHLLLLPADGITLIIITCRWY